MIHDPHVIERYVPNRIIGTIGGSGAVASAAPPAAGGGGAPKSQAVKGPDGRMRDWSLAKKNQEERLKEHGKIPGCCGAVFYFALGFLREIVKTIFSQTNWSITGDRSGLTRSAMFLFLFIIIHAV